MTSVAMKTIRVSLLSAGLVLCTYSSGHGQELDTQKKALIDELLAQTGQSASAVGLQMANAYIKQISQMMKQADPELDPRALDIVSQEVGLIMQEEFVDKGMLGQMMHPIYDRHFSVEELRDIIAFYKSPTGMKTLDLMPLISQEGMQAGQQFGQSLAPVIERRINERLAAEGIQLP